MSMLWPDVFIASVIVLVMASRVFYVLSLRLFSRLWLRQHSFGVTDFQFSFEEIHYTVSLSGADSAYIDTKIEDIVIRPVYVFVVFPRLVGLRMLVRKPGSHRVLVAYLPVEVFNSPLLDQLYSLRQISLEVQERLRRYFLLHPFHKQAIRAEVYQRIQAGPGHGRELAIANDL